MWTNKDTENHQVVCKACPFTSPVLKAGETYSYQFNKVGRFTTEDPLNGDKKGTVTVKAVAAALTLSATPTAETYGSSTTLAGSLSTQQSGQKVSIDAQPCDAHSAKSVANVTTTTGGAFTDQERPTMNTAYQASFKPATIEHLELKTGEVVHASVALRVNNAETVIVGGLAPMNMEPGRMTFSQDFLNKLPF